MLMDWYKNVQKLKNELLAEWEVLLNENGNENKYQSFLSNYAGLFLGNENCHLAISKLKLGSELETDFVTLTDGFSNGNVFEFIELKQPNTKLFTKNGTPTADFNRAIQQIRDWKRWLIDNKNWMKKHLPTTSTRVITDSNIKFKIVIGRRLDNIYEIDKRNQISEEIKAEIRSFDYLTDKVKSRIIYPSTWLSADVDYLSDQLANPFFAAMTDAEWKKFCSSKQLRSFHFYSHHCEEVLKSRKFHRSIIKALKI